MAWIKQELEYENQCSQLVRAAKFPEEEIQVLMDKFFTDRSIALDLSIRVKEEGHDFEEQSMDMKTEDNKRKMDTVRIGSKSTVSSIPCAFLVDGTSSYCVKCNLRHEGDCSLHSLHGDLSSVDDVEVLKALHDGGSIQDYRSQILALPSMLGNMSEIENKEHFDTDVLFPVNKSKKGRSSMKKKLEGTTIAEADQLNDFVDPRLDFTGLMNPYACFDEALQFFETPNYFAASQDVSHRKLNDIFFMCEKGDQLCESYKLHSGAPFRKRKTVRTVTNSFRHEDGNEVLSSCGKLKRVKRSQSEVKIHKCSDCGVRFSSIALLSAHKEVCTGEKPYKCDICGVGFCVNSSLVTHIRIHTGEKPYKCDICGASFTVNSSLISHIRTHTGEKPYKCDICGVGFTVSSGLRTHKRIHTGEKPYKCDICGSEFTCCSSLKSHKRIHTGEKPYRCDICGVGFPVNGSLKSHKRIHTGEKPYRCDICGVGFTVSTSLSSHRRIHTGEKPYKCDVCGINFTRNGHLQRHMKIHPKEELCE